MAIRAAAALREREKKVKEAKESLGNFKSLAQKEGLEKKRKGGQKFQKEAGKVKLKKVVKNFLKTNDVKKTAEIVGISHSQTTRYLKSEEGARTLAEAFEKSGLGKENIAKIAKEEFLEYNKQKVIRSYGEGINAREVEEMRDGRLAFNALQFAAKYIEADANTIAQTRAVEVSGDIALLAVKNLILKLNHKQLRTVQESIQALLDDNMKVVEV